MSIITVNTSKKYDVMVANGALQQLGSTVKAYTRANRVMIVSDTNVWPLYGQAALDSLSGIGLNEVSYFVFTAGEQSKCGSTYLQLLEELANAHITRSDCIIALGGGVVGDLAGFAAATYLRGIDYIQVPTTLLACVDSSVGGKTAIDLAAGKNLAGAFYQPCAVLCDIDTLGTLPEEVFRDGCAEVIKYGILYDEALFHHLWKNGLSFDREYVISRCIELKRNVVADDEIDRSARQKLNLGHTFGHAIEKHSNFTLSHGKAVAIGMAIISRSASAMELCSREICAKIEDTLLRFGLPNGTELSAEAILDAALSDKKRFDSTLNLIIPTRIGSCDIVPTEISRLIDVIKAGL